jgi:hypothetical protein
MEPLMPFLQGGYDSVPLARADHIKKPLASKRAGQRLS